MVLRSCNLMEDLNLHPFILYFCLHPKLKTKLAIYFIYVYYRILSSGKLSFFCGLTKSGNLRAFLSMNHWLNWHKMTSSIYVNGLQKIDTWNNSKRKCGKSKVESEKWSDNIMVLSLSSQEMSIKKSQQKPPLQCLLS